MFLNKRNIHVAILMTIASFLLNCSPATKSSDTGSSSFFSVEQPEIATELLSLIQTAETSFYLCIPNFNNSEIADALINANSKFTDVAVVVDSRYITQSETARLINSRVSVHSRAYDAFMNSFFAVIDGKSVMTGTVDLTAANTNSISAAIVMYDETMAKYYTKEFRVLQMGLSPLSKDYEFDSLLGPTGDYFESGWYLKNQINTNLGITKGRWPKISLSDINQITPYFMPYPQTERSYEYFVYDPDANIYTLNDSTELIYYDYDLEEEAGAARTDFAQILRENILGATESVIVFSKVLNDPVAIDDLITQHTDGIKTEIFLDYNSALTTQSSTAKSLQALKENSDGLFLCRPDNGTMNVNVVIIDKSTVIMLSGPITINSFTNNDCTGIVCENSETLARELLKTRQKALYYSQEYLPSNDYSNNFDPVEFGEKL